MLFKSSFSAWFLCLCLARSADIYWITEEIELIISRKRRSKKRRRKKKEAGNFQNWFISIFTLPNCCWCAWDNLMCKVFADRFVFLLYLSVYLSIHPLILRRRERRNRIRSNWMSQSDRHMCVSWRIISMHFDAIQEAKYGQVSDSFLSKGMENRSFEMIYVCQYWNWTRSVFLWHDLMRDIQILYRIQMSMK